MKQTRIAWLIVAFFLSITVFVIFYLKQNEYDYFDSQSYQSFSIKIHVDNGDCAKIVIEGSNDNINFVIVSQLSVINNIDFNYHTNGLYRYTKVGVKSCK